MKANRLHPLQNFKVAETKLFWYYEFYQREAVDDQKNKKSSLKLFDETQNIIQYGPQ